MSVCPFCTGYLGRLFHFCCYFVDGALRCMGAPVCSFQHIMHGRAGAPSGKIYLVGILNFDLSNLILPRVANFLIQFFNRGKPNN